MSFLRYVMLLSLVVWVGGGIFFAFVLAPTAFQVLPNPHLAGNVVGRALAKLHWIAISSGIVFLISSLAHSRWMNGTAHVFAMRNMLVSVMLVLTLVFSSIMRFPIPHYAIFLLSVLLPWTFFAQTLSYAVEAIVTNGDLIKKVAVPKLVFPMAAVVSNIINLLLSLIPLALLVPIMRHPFYWTWLYLPVPRPRFRVPPK